LRKVWNIILKGVNGKVQIIFLANLIDYFSNQKPTLFIYLQEYDNMITDTEKIQADYNLFYSRCVAENVKKAES